MPTALCLPLPWQQYSTRGRSIIEKVLKGRTVYSPQRGAGGWGAGLQGMWQSKLESEVDVPQGCGGGGSLGGNSRSHTLGEQQSGWSALPLLD